jgi:hypothetical protein
VSDLPIIFSAPMVRALLDGRKTMTRRILKPQPKRFLIDGVPSPITIMQLEGQRPRIAIGRVLTVQGVRWAPGDRLYVRENFQLLSFGDYAVTKGQPCDIRYAATDALADCDRDVRGYPWRPSIHMPRWASRLTLVVTATKIEPIRSINDRQSEEEGVEGVYGKGWKNYDQKTWAGVATWPSPTGSFCSLWSSLHGLKSWNDDQEVVALTFTVHKVNIDEMAKEAA